jgi:16S rRNA processing protein RimM
MRQNPPVPSLSEPAESWVLLARIVRPQGRRGEVLADIFTDFPERFAERHGLFLRPPASTPSIDMREATVEASWLHQGRVVLKLAQVNSITDAETLRGFDVVIRREARMPLKDDAIYVSDLVGMRVIDVRNGGAQDTGEIVDVEPEGIGPSMLVVQTQAGNEALIPFVRAYLRNVNVAAKRLEMDLPEGLVAMQAPLTEQERLAQQQAPDEAE